MKKNPIVTMKIKDIGTIKIELYPDEAPQTVKNFISLTNNKFFDGLKFWRIEKNGIQSGCINNRGDGRIGYAIKGEFTENGVENNIKRERGIITMARVTPNSASSHFNILLRDNLELQGKYAAFGKVISGMDVADKVGKTKAVKDGVLMRATEDAIIEKVTVNTFGVVYDEPEKLPELSIEERKIELDKLLKQIKIEQEMEKGNN